MQYITKTLNELELSKSYSDVHFNVFAYEFLKYHIRVQAMYQHISLIYIKSWRSKIKGRTKWART